MVLTTTWILGTVALLLIPVWLAQNVIHEKSHGLVLDITGRPPYVTRSLPHWWHPEHGFVFFPTPWGGGKDWMFYFASFEVKESLDSLSRTQRMFLWVAPRIANTFFLILAAVFLYTNLFGAEVSTLWTMIAGAQIIDGFVGIVAIFCWWQDRTWTDIWKFYQESGWAKWKVVVGSLVWFLSMLFLFIFPLGRWF